MGWFKFGCLVASIDDFDLHKPKVVYLLGSSHFEDIVKFSLAEIEPRRKLIFDTFFLEENAANLCVLFLKILAESYQRALFMIDADSISYIFLFFKNLKDTDGA